MLRSLRSLRGSVRLGRSATLHSHGSAHFTHIFAALVLLRKPLFGLQKRHIQPERYVQFGLKFVENIWTKNVKHDI
jgi:hypothetical protein